MCNPKRIEDITVSDLLKHRWCYYQNDAEGYDCFEYVVPDSHPGFSEDVSEMELAEFIFSEGSVLLGMYDGSESFHILDGEEWYSFWYGVSKPSSNTISRVKCYLQSKGLKLPVTACAKRSGKTKVFKGLQYIDASGNFVEVAI